MLIFKKIYMIRYIYNSSYVFIFLKAGPGVFWLLVPCLLCYIIYCFWQKCKMRARCAFYKYKTSFYIALLYLYLLLLFNKLSCTVLQHMHITVWTNSSKRWIWYVADFSLSSLKDFLIIGTWSPRPSSVRFICWIELRSLEIETALIFSLSLEMLRHVDDHDDYFAWLSTFFPTQKLLYLLF